MVNYCCVVGCGRNSKTSKHLYYYSVPKEKERQEHWLKAAGRLDLLYKPQDKRSYRFCSRHFSSSSIKNKHLCADAVPTLCLPGSGSEISDDSDVENATHYDISCDNCSHSIIGFRYKCITCVNFDLCSKCEMMETHAEHYMLRIPNPSKFKQVDDVVNKCQQIFKPNEADNDTSDDDEPITKYVKNYDSGIDLSEDIKTKIRNEVSRVLRLKNSDKKKKKTEMSIVKKRPATNVERLSKSQKIKMDVMDVLNDLSTSSVQEVAFADVNEVGTNLIIDVKSEVPSSIAPTIEVADPKQPMMHMKLSDDLTELMIEVNDQKTVYKFDM